MQKLEQKHENENKVCEQLKDLDCKLDNVSDSTKKDVQYKSMWHVKFQRIKIENVDGATEEVDLLKKQEIEKQKLMENDANRENEIEQVCWVVLCCVMLCCNCVVLYFIVLYCAVL